VLIAVFATLPFCSAAGTGNPVYLNTLLAMAGWFALLALLFAMLSHITQCPLLFQAGTLLVGAFACSQIVTGYQVSPYRLAAPIFAQAIPTAIGTPQTNVRLDSRTSLFFESLRRAALASGLKPEDDVIAFFNMPGVVYALGARSPAAPWYHAGYPGSKRMNEMLVSMMPSDRLARAYILHKEGNAADFPDLTIVGVQFPQAYQVIAEATWPVTGERVRLWKPRAR